MGPAVLGTVPEPVAHDLLQNLGRAHDVVFPEVERREAEAHDVGRAEIARAALESVGYQTRDLLEAIAADLPVLVTFLLLLGLLLMSGSKARTSTAADILEGARP